MSYREIIINGESVKLIPLGECACGCGGKTTIIPKTNKPRGLVKGCPHKYLHGHGGYDFSIHTPKKEKVHWNWHGGRIIDINGYIRVLMPIHPRADCKGYVFEHILVAEAALGKPLPTKAKVHHYNGKQDNKSLIICNDHSYHMLIEYRTKAYKACGHADWMKCTFCQNWDSPSKMYVKSPPAKTGAYHRKCRNTYLRNKKTSTESKKIQP